MTDSLQSSSTLFNSVLLFFHNCQRYPKREADAQEGVLNGQFELTRSQYCKFSKRVRTIALDTRLWFWRRHCHSPMPNRRLARHSKGAERIPTHQASLAPMAFSAPTAESTWEWSQTARNTEIHSTMLAKELANLLPHVGNLSARLSLLATSLRGTDDRYRIPLTNSPVRILIKTALTLKVQAPATVVWRCHNCSIWVTGCLCSSH